MFFATIGLPDSSYLRAASPARVALADAARIVRPDPTAVEDGAAYQRRERARRAAARARWNVMEERRAADLAAVIKSVPAPLSVIAPNARAKHHAQRRILFVINGIDGFPVASIEPQGASYALRLHETLSGTLPPRTTQVYSARTSGERDARAACLSFFLRLRAGNRDTERPAAAMANSYGRNFTDGVTKQTVFRWPGDE